uniref:Uncharacterized protein n=1 Tax=Nomascus leucogenys TaxID=61853 RepID=A0A2I3H4E7_NOMLE
VGPVCWYVLNSRPALLPDLDASNKIQASLVRSGCISTVVSFNKMASPLEICSSYLLRRYHLRSELFSLCILNAFSLKNVNQEY